LARHSHVIWNIPDNPVDDVRHHQDYPTASNDSYDNLSDLHGFVLS